MSDSARILEIIDLAVKEHGGDLGGTTNNLGDSLQLFDGRVTLTVKLEEPCTDSAGQSIHAHLLALLHEYDDEVLDACVFGMGEDQMASIRDVCMIWMTAVAGPIKSFLDQKPLHMSSLVEASNLDPSGVYPNGKYGLTGARGYVGPSIARGLDNEELQAWLDDTKPFFLFAAESSGPRRVHLAKVMIVANGESGWSRELELNGHEVSLSDRNWPAGHAAPDYGYLTLFAVFEFAEESHLRKRAELDRTLRHFAKNFHRHESVDQLMEEMVNDGFDADVVHETEAISTIAFGRFLFEEHGVQYSSTIIRARRDGRIETDVPLMSLPAYSRARALAPELITGMLKQDYQSLCLYNAESHAILQALEGQPEDYDLSQLTMYPCVVPDRGVSDATMNAALAKLDSMLDQNCTPAPPKKTRWKFW